jgi:hypothetical protein
MRAFRPLKPEETQGAPDSVVQVSGMHTCVRLSLGMHACVRMSFETYGFTHRHKAIYGKLPPASVIQIAGTARVQVHE